MQCSVDDVIAIICSRIFSVSNLNKSTINFQNICCNHSKIWTMWLYHGVISPNDADGMANSVDPDQTAPLGAVWSGSALFAQAYLFENIGSLRYVWNSQMILAVRKLRMSSLIMPVVYILNRLLWDYKCKFGLAEKYIFGNSFAKSGENSSFCDGNATFVHMLLWRTVEVIL